MFYLNSLMMYAVYSVSYCTFVKHYFSTSSKVSGIFLPLVSGTKIVRTPEITAMAVKMMYGKDW